VSRDRFERRASVPTKLEPAGRCSRKLVVDQRGKEAATLAAGRTDQLLEDGDIDGALVWRRILAAVEELQQGRREGDKVN
jgi:hypothetical protein